MGRENDKKFKVGRSLYHKEWYSANRAKVLAKQKKRYLEKKEEILLYTKEWYANNKGRVAERARERKLEQLYGMTVDDYKAMLEEQEGRCKCCGASNGWRGNLVVDHCHVTGAVRGLLCDRCNTVLGQCEDSVEILQNLIDYLGGDDE